MYDGNSQDDLWVRDTLSHSVSPQEAGVANHELVLGAYETIVRRPHELVKLSQIRKERNVVTDELKESIVADGLMNPIDVARVERPLLEQYIAFVNRTWSEGDDPSSLVSIDDFDVFLQDDGTYLLVIAGHTRHQAVEELIAEGRLPQNTGMMAKVHDVSTVWDIIAKQRAENIHSQPPRERDAMGLVEAYYWGLEMGDWSNEREFIASQEAVGRNATRGALDQALKYARLPNRIRNFVLSGHIPYLAGVELGASVAVIADYHAARLGYRSKNDPAITDEQRALLNDFIVKELDILCIGITGGRLNATAAQKRIVGKRKEWRNITQSLLNPDKRQPSISDEMFFKSDQWEIQRREIEKRMRTEWRELMRKYGGSDVVDFVRQHQGILPDEDVDHLIHELDARRSETKKRLGAGAVVIVGLSEKASLF